MIRNISSVLVRDNIFLNRKAKKKSRINIYILLNEINLITKN